MGLHILGVIAVAVIATGGAGVIVANNNSRSLTYLERQYCDGWKIPLQQCRDLYGVQPQQYAFSGGNGQNVTVAASPQRQPAVQRHPNGGGYTATTGASSGVTASAHSGGSPLPNTGGQYATGGRSLVPGGAPTRYTSEIQHPSASVGVTYNAPASGGGSPLPPGYAGQSGGRTLIPQGDNVPSQTQTYEPQRAAPTTYPKCDEKRGIVDSCMSSQ